MAEKYRPDPNEITLQVLSKDLKRLNQPIEFGGHLGIEEYLLEKFETNNRNNIDGQKRELFSHICHNYNSLKITWHKIADSLELVNMKDLADDIREKHGCQLNDQKIDGDTFLNIPADNNKLVKELGSHKLPLGAKNQLVKLITEAEKVSEKVPETGPPTRGSDTEPIHQPGHPYTNGTRSSDNNDLEQVLETGTHTKKMLIVFADGKKSDLDDLSDQQILDLVDNNTILRGDNLTDVIDCLQTASANWYQICTNLYITKNKIDSLKHSNNPDEVRLIEALSDWLKLNYNYQKHGKPTWRQVARSVSKIDSALFLDISKKHLKEGVSTREE